MILRNHIRNFKGFLFLIKHQQSLFASTNATRKDLQAMKKIEIALRPVDKPISNVVNTRVSRPESIRVKTMRIIRLPFANLKKSSDLAHLISPLANIRESKEKTSILSIEDSFTAPKRTGSRKFMMSASQTKLADVQIVKANTYEAQSKAKPAEPITSSPANDFNFMTSKRASTQLETDKNSFEVTDYGFFRNSPTNRIKVKHSIIQSQSKESLQNNGLSPIDFAGPLQSMSPEASKKDYFHFGGSDSCFEGEAETHEYTNYTLPKQRNSISETGKGGLIHNFSTSLSSHNTLVSDNQSPSFKSRENPKTYNNFASKLADSKMIGSGSLERKSFKTLSKIKEAKMIANIYNDQMIKQFQFNKEDEDEEINFLELCDALNTHI